MPLNHQGQVFLSYEEFMETSDSYLYKFITNAKELALNPKP